MSRRIRGLPPRLVLQARDNATGSYPTILRTGDGDRTGNHGIFYDDTETLVFTDRSISPFTTVDPPITNFHTHPEFSGSLVAYWDLSRENSVFQAGSPYHVYHPDLFTGSLDLTSSSDITPIRQPDIFQTDTPTNLNVPNSINYSWGLQPSFGAPGDRYKSWVSGSASNNFSFGNGTTDTPFSISMWLKRNSAHDFADDITGEKTPGTVIPIQAILSKSGSTGVEWSLTFRQGSGYTDGFYLELLDDSSGGVINKRFGQFGTGETLELGKWYHLGISYDGSGNTSGINANIDGEGISAGATVVSGSYTAMEVTGQELTIAAKEMLPEAADSAIEQQAGGFKMTDLAFFNRVVTQHEFRKIFAAKRGINLPSGLPQSSRFLTSDNQTSMVMNYSHNKSIPDQFISLREKLVDERTNNLVPKRTLNQKPFNEAFRPEQSQETNFYLTGTKEKDSGLSFSSRLGSKLTLSREFSIDTEKIMPSTTASLFYFRPNIQRFTDVTVDPHPTSATPHNALFYDAKLFGPLGNLCLTGSLRNSIGPPNFEYLYPAGAGSVPLTGRLSQAGEIYTANYPNNLLQNQDYTAIQGGNNPHYFEISEIEHPFLLEKVVLELPFSASSDWFSDTTRFQASDAIGVIATDIGGPAITVALMREEENINHLDQTGSLMVGHRDLICSGTIIPVGDNTRSTRTTNWNGDAPTGFLSYATPNVVVTPDAGGGFSGVVTLEMTPAITNGFYTVINNNFSIGSTDVIKNFAPLGRAGNGQDSGRSFFGKEFSSSDTVISTNTLNYTGSTDWNIFMHASSLVSPYILNKNDKLVIAVSKFRSAISEGFIASSRSTILGTHTVALTTGKMNLRLYGSNIKNCEESNNDWYNQPLTSMAVHEDVHGDNPITDQFDLSPLQTLSGSYVDNFITGSTSLQPGGLYDAGNFGDDNGTFSARVRGRVRSVIGTNVDNKIYRVTAGPSNADERLRVYSVPHMIRHVTLYDRSSRFYDTFMPKFDQIYTKYTGEHKVYFDANFKDFAEYSINANSTEDTENHLWMFEFPFEPNNTFISGSSVPRLSTFAKNVAAVKDGDTANERITSRVQVEQSEREILTYAEHTSNTIRLPVEERLIVAAIFGFHNGFGIGNVDEFGEWIPRQIGLHLPNGKPRPRFDDNMHFQIRGFKYGVYHCAPVGRSYAFRRDRFGQMRDMLEQSLDSKMSEEIGVDGKIKRRSIVSPVQARFTSTDDSSNTDTECAQGLPYFDGVSRNYIPPA